MAPQTNLRSKTCRSAEVLCNDLKSACPMQMHVLLLHPLAPTVIGHACKATLCGPRSQQVPELKSSTS